MNSSLNESIYEDQIYSQIKSYYDSQNGLKSFIDSQISSEEFIELYLINDAYLNQWKKYSCYEEIKNNLPLKNINKLKELRTKTNAENNILSNINNLSLFEINSNNNNNEPNLEKIKENSNFHIINKECLQNLSLNRAIDKEIKILFQIFNGKLIAKYYNQIIVLYKHNNRLNLILLFFKNTYQNLEIIYEQLKIIETYELLFNHGIDCDYERQEILKGSIIFLNKSFSNLKLEDKLEEERIKKAISSLINLEINFYPNLISGGMNNLNTNLYLINDDWLQQFKNTLNYIELNQNSGILNQNQDSIINKMFKSYKENPYALKNEIINEENNIYNYLKENSTGNFIKLYSNYALITEDLWNNLIQLFKWSLEIKVNINIIKNNIIIIYNNKDFEFFELLNNKTKKNNFFFHFNEDRKVNQIILQMKNLGVSQFFKKYNINLSQESTSNFKLIENNNYIGNAININAAKKNFEEYSLLIKEQIHEKEMIMGYNGGDNLLMSVMNQININEVNFNNQNNNNQNENINCDFGRMNLNENKNIKEISYTGEVLKKLNNIIIPPPRNYIEVNKPNIQNNNITINSNNMPFNNNIINNNNIYNQNNRNNIIANNNNFGNFNNMNIFQTNNNINNNNYQQNINNFNNNFNNNNINLGFHQMNSFDQINMNNQNNINLNRLSSFDQSKNMFTQHNQNLMNNLMIGNLFLPKNDILKAIILCLFNCKIFLQNINKINNNQQNKPIINSLKYILESNDYNNGLSKLKENINKKSVQNIDLEDPKIVFKFIIESINKEIGGISQNNKNIDMSLAQFINNEMLLFQEFVSQIFQPMNNTFISQNCFGINEIYYKCNICKKMNYNFEIFELIEFSVEDINNFLVNKLPNYITNENSGNSQKFIKIMKNNSRKIIQLEDCFDYYSRNEIKKNNKCFSCNINGECSEYCKLMQVPNILFITLKNKKNYSVSVELIEKLNITVNQYNKHYELISAIIISNQDEKYYALIKNESNNLWELHLENNNETINLFDIQKKGFPFLLIYQLKK